MTLQILLANRIIKIVGNVLKMLCYPFHFMFPNKRFTIPLQSAPLVKSKQQTKIPKIIWQTNFTNRVTLPLYLNYLFNRLMAPTYEYRYMGTREMIEFFKNIGNEKIYSAFMQFNEGAAQADFWRMVVLNHIGGVYMDLDAHLIWPLEWILKNDDEALYITAKDGLYDIYFVASKKENPYLEKTIEQVVDNIMNKRVEGGVWRMTGPNVINKVIGDDNVNCRSYQYVAVQGSFTNEYFQYIDKKKGKWTYQKEEDILVS